MFWSDVIKNIPSLRGSFILINHSLPPLAVGYIFFIPKISFVAESGAGEEDGNEGVVSIDGLGFPGGPPLTLVSILAPADLYMEKSCPFLAKESTVPAISKISIITRKL
jgi:hypothetical protein